MTRERFITFRLDVHFGLTTRVTNRCPWMRKRRMPKRKLEKPKAPDFVDTS